MNETRIVQKIDIERGSVDSRYKKPFIKFNGPKNNKPSNSLLDIKIVRAVKHKLYQNGKMHFGFKL